MPDTEMSRSELNVFLYKCSSIGEITISADPDLADLCLKLLLMHDWSNTEFSRLLTAVTSL